MFLLLSESFLEFNSYISASFVDYVRYFYYISVTDNITVVCSNYYIPGYIVVFIMLLNFFMYNFNFVFILAFILRIFCILRIYIFYINRFYVKTISIEKNPDL